ncbi:hypothetical protein QTP70_019100 [Hemibagrus guttatus]|uniref:Retrotransposon gag domain-containing protein n=1 Tax=Hemibagrus guttatus TaxID=175788 RepID=A0AAE0RHW0_9TELE|nr:hypothetical protein QTP70_019100 [Hemibagrus guttatus]
MYHEEGTKCAFLLSLLSSRALEWALAVWDANPQVRSSFPYFVGMIREVFEHPAGGKDISDQLMELRQGSEAAADYAIRFRTLAAQSGWNEAASWAVFRAGLNPALQTELAQPIGEGYLKRQTELLEFQVGLFHHEQLAFYVTYSPVNPVIQGFPWLRRHDPQISWCTGELARWSPTCLKECLREPVSRPCRTSCIEEATPVVHGHLPQPYADFWEVFSEERAVLLPAHQVWDCAIDPLPNTSLPKGRIYPLSLPESKAMEDYIEGALAVGSCGTLILTGRSW